MQLGSIHHAKGVFKVRRGTHYNRVGRARANLLVLLGAVKKQQQLLVQQQLQQCAQLGISQE